MVAQHILSSDESATMVGGRAVMTDFGTFSSYARKALAAIGTPLRLHIVRANGYRHFMSRSSVGIVD